MALIDFDDTLPQLHNPTSPARGHLFGVIKCEIFAVEVSGVDENNEEILHPGTLIQIKPGYRGDECLFKIRNFTNWLDKYKTTIYKCKKTDYIAISGELWPYLVSFKNDEHLLKLVEGINTTEFDLNMLKLGSEVRIRRPPGNEDKYYEFVVAYNGLMKEITTTGYYVGLQLKNDRVPLTSDLKRLSQHYQFEGTGIIVQIDWIMLNLYTEKERQLEPQIVEYNEASSNVLSADINDSEAKNNNFKNCRDRSPIKPPKKISDIAVSGINLDFEIENNDVQISPTTREQRVRSSESPMETTNFTTETNVNNNANGAMKMSESMSKDMLQTLPIDLVNHEYSKKNNDENHVLPKSAINKQPNKIIGTSALSKHGNPSPETPYGSSSNYRALKISESGDISHKREDHDASTSQINEEPNHTIEIGATSEQHDEIQVSLRKTTTNYNAFKTEFKNNADGSVKISETPAVYNNHLLPPNYLDKSHDIQIPSINEQPKNTIDNGVTSEQSDQLLKFSRETTTNYTDAKTEFNNHAYEAVKISETLTRTMPIGFSENVLQAPPINKIFETSAISNHREQLPKTPYNSGSTYGIEIESITKFNGAVKINESGARRQVLPIGWTTNNKTDDVSTPSINEQPTHTNKIGSISEQRDQKFEFPWEADGASKLSETRAVPDNNPIFPNDYVDHERNKNRALSNTARHDVQTPSINEHLKIITETVAVSENREQSPKTLNDTTLNYDSNIEPVTNADGAIRNTEKTKCGYCSLTVKIGDGFTLRQCSHSFCTACIRFHVNERNSKESEIRCPYKKDCQCYFSLKDAEIKDFKREAIYNKIPGNMLEKFDDNEAEALALFNSGHEPGEHKSRVQPTNVQSKIQYETDSSLDQSLENSCHTTLNYTAEIELFTNADGAVKNAEKTNCDFCHITVEIGEGIILRECLHSFCTKCIRRHVYSNSKCSKIRCPYKQDYECEFDLQDVEIKDLGGEKLYNTIVENRLKEYMATEPNARWCTNKDCENVWVSQRDGHQQNERCPKCNVNFCLVCQNAHEPDERHENKSMTSAFLGKVKKIAKAYRPEPSGYCVICRKTNISANKYIRLQNCNHTICTDCVIPMIKLQRSRSIQAHCTICNVYLSDYEIAKIPELEVSGLHRNINRKIQPEVPAPLQICICRPSLGNCGFTLQCNHTFCRTYIAGIVREQFNNKGYAVCPRCIHKIDKNTIRHLVPALFKEEIVEKCKICIDVVQFRLTNCQHGFCLKCIRALIVDQVFDANKMNIVCTVCNMQVRNDDILRYGGQEIYAGFILKTETDAYNRSLNKNN